MGTIDSNKNNDAGIVENLLNKACKALTPESGQPGRDNEFIDYEEAFYRVNTIQGANYLGAQEVSVDMLREFIRRIDDYNENHSASGKEFEITSVRIWKAVSHFDNTHRNVDDLVICPVRRDGNDAHAYSEDLWIHREDSTKGKLQMLSSGRPCPNLCGDGRKYFFKEDAVPIGFPDPHRNPYENVQFADVRIENETDFNENTLIR